MTGSHDPLPSSLDLQTLGLPQGPEHPCPYLEGRLARERAFMADSIPPGLYHRLMDFGWRRSGRLLYRPDCDGCAECVPIRIPVNEFRPSRTQRKVEKRNADLEWRLSVPVPTDEKFDLFVRYQQGRHTGDMCTEREDFERFLYEYPIKSRECEARLDGRLLVSAIIDVEPRSISSVYTYYDPGEKHRSLGVAAILALIGYARRRGVSHYYLGYHIRGCAKMSYKVAYRPCELCDSRGTWTRHEPTTEAQ